MRTTAPDEATDDAPGGDPAGARTPRLHFQHWPRMDPDWLLERLRAGHRPNRLELQARWAAVAGRRAAAARRAGEPFGEHLLLDGTTTGRLSTLGARVDVHTEDLCRLLVGQETWEVRRRGPCFQVHTPRGGRGRVRIVELGPAWLVALVGSTLVGGDAPGDLGGRGAGTGPVRRGR